MAQSRKVSQFFPSKMKLVDIFKRFIKYCLPPLFISIFCLVPLGLVDADVISFDLDKKHKPQNMTMVVARYNENLDWLKNISWNYIIFNKGEDSPKWVKSEVKLQNIGREAHSYLTYIIDNYDNLPDYTIFVQGNPFDHSKELIKKINNFDGKSDFFALSDSTLYDNGYGNPHHTGLKIAESAERIFINNIESFEFPMGAEFIVSKKAILFHSKMTYQKIIDFLIEAEPLDKRYPITEEDDCPGSSNLFSAWTMERLWKTLFDSENQTFYD